MEWKTLENFEKGEKVEIKDGHFSPYTVLCRGKQSVFVADKDGDERYYPLVDKARLWHPPLSVKEGDFVIATRNYGGMLAIGKIKEIDNNDVFLVSTQYAILPCRIADWTFERIVTEKD